MKVTLIAAMLAMGAGCKKNTDNKPTAAPTGSATAGSGSGSAAATAPKPLSQDELAKRAHECSGYWRAGKWDDLQSCYAKDAGYEAPGSGLPSIVGSAAIVELAKSERAAFPDQKGESQLLLVNGKKAVAITLVTGKNTGAMKTPAGDMPATNNTIGLYRAAALTFDDAGNVTHEDTYLDTATELGQLKPVKDHPVRPVIEKLAMPVEDVIAKDDAKEKANLATFQQLTDRLNKHDAKGVGELLADDVMWSEQPWPKDVTKKELMAELPKQWKGFSDLKLTVSDSWAAGDYVAAIENFEGTNDGDLPMMHVKKTGKKVSLPFLAVHKIDGGKVKATWIFSQGMGLANQLGIAQATTAKPAAPAPATNAAAKPVEKKN